MRPLQRKQGTDIDTVNSLVQVIVPGEVLRPWLAEGGASPAVRGVTGLDVSDGGVLKLFSLNDYLGLSTHPAVCQAAADAALLYGSGASPGPSLELPQLAMDAARRLAEQSVE